jgi:type I restriction enzyme R subunit
MPENEAAARIKINALLQDAGWRFFAEDGHPANIKLESGVTLEAMGDDFQGTKHGFVDFLLLDSRNFPLVVLEAKAESMDPLVGKEQARKYARSLSCRFVLLSNGNLHYFWDLERGNPYVITAFPTPESVGGYLRTQPNPHKLAEELVDTDYIVLTQRPGYQTNASWKNEDERPAFIKANKLRFLREYQLRAVKSLQQVVAKGQDRFLFEMATGTGKTLTAAAVIKLFLRSGNARRVLFLVDRLELEVQAKKAFDDYLKPDYATVIYKQNRDDWRRAEVVVTTVQSLQAGNKYRRLFSPTDFDLVISDEAHRSIGGNARAVFDYFIGYKLGLTATPRDYLKRFEAKGPATKDPREYERRLLLDTYRTFGCDSGQPTFRYSLTDGVKDGFLISPTVVDVRTDITTALLSEDGFTVAFTDEEGDDREETFKQREFERRFFSNATNQVICKTFLEHALKDPVSGEVGKSILFAVSQKHATKLVQILNQMADLMYPGKYQSDFAVQVTSQIPEAQQFTVNFSNNHLLGTANFLPTYRTSKARVCVTVGMMTTGYDCTDILNIGLLRPIFSPTDFIQIKGRGTRTHDFRDQLFDEAHKEHVQEPRKSTFKLFDFFATCEYFEEDYNYDEVLLLPPPSRKPRDTPPDEPAEFEGTYAHLGADILSSIREVAIGYDGMKIDRMFFERFEEAVKEHPGITEAVEAGQWDRVIDLVNQEVFHQPEDYFDLEKLRQATPVDRRLGLREILEKIFGLIPFFKSKDQLLEEEFATFIAGQPPEDVAAIPAIKTYFKAYATDNLVRHIIETRQYTDLATNPSFSAKDFRLVPAPFRDLVPAYIKDYVSLNQFAA